MTQIDGDSYHNIVFIYVVCFSLILLTICAYVQTETSNYMYIVHVSVQCYHEHINDKDYIHSHVIQHNLPSFRWKIYLGEFQLQLKPM